MKFTSWGAARQVTGSMHLLELDNGYRVLVDCGLQYEKQNGDTLAANQDFPFNPASIDALVLTHAHIDHSGNLPNLVNQGFKGTIYCTLPTADLSELLLHDSYHVQLGDVKKQRARNNRRKGKKNRGIKPALESGRLLYTYVHIEQTLKQIGIIDFHQLTRIGPGVTLELYPSGHILGAASALISVEEGGTVKRIGFTGDIGNPDSPLVVDPQIMKELDYLVTESTYAGRYHQCELSHEDELFRFVKQACIDQPGRLVIPAFSVGRTQAIAYTLARLHAAGKLPPIKVFVDSPLGIRSSAVYHRYMGWLNQEAQAFKKEEGDLFEYENLYMVEDQQDSEEIRTHFEPCIIVSAAGMVEGGRIQEHIRNNIQNPYCTILIAGYCAEGTLGHRLLQGQPTVRIRDRDMQVYARIETTDVFSAHADFGYLQTYVEQTKEAGILRKVFLVHGEESRMEIFKETLTGKGLDVVIPLRGETFTL